MRIARAGFLAGIGSFCFLAGLPPGIMATENSVEAPAAPATIQPGTAPTPTPVASTVTTPPGSVTLRANSLVPLRVLEPISSETTAIGTHFQLEVTDDIDVDDTVVIPAGSIAVAEVIHAAKSGMLGKAGELSVSARFVTVGERSIRLRAALGSAGANRTMLAWFIPFTRGGKMEIPVGTQLVAKVAVDEVFQTPAPAPTPLAVAPAH